MHAQFYDELLWYFVRQVQDEHEAQDLVQEAYGRLLAREAAGERIEHPRALLYGIARNLLIDRARQLQVRGHVSDEVLADMRAPASVEPDARYGQRQRMRLLTQTINGLPLRCRQAFVLHKLDGFSHAEVAARMGISLNMVERHVMLAVAACRQALSGDRARRRAATAGPPESAGESTVE